MSVHLSSWIRVGISFVVGAFVLVVLCYRASEDTRRPFVPLGARAVRIRPGRKLNVIDQRKDQAGSAAAHNARVGVPVPSWISTVGPICPFPGTGCAWTLQHSCPGQPLGTRGVADDGTQGHRCCCGAAQGWQIAASAARGLGETTPPHRPAPTTVTDAEQPNGYDPLPPGQPLMVYMPLPSAATEGGASGASAGELGPAAGRAATEFHEIMITMLRNSTVAAVNAGTSASARASQAALAVLRRATYPSATPLSLAIAIEVDSRVSVVEWGTHGRFSRLIARDYCGARGPAEPVCGVDPSALPWFAHTRRIGRATAQIRKAQLTTVERLLSRVVLEPPPRALHALLFAHDYPAGPVYNSVESQPAAQPAPWLMFTIPADQWRQPGMKAIVTPYELNANFSEWAAAIATPFAKKKNVLMWRGSRKWHPVRNVVINMSEEARGLPKGHGEDNHRGPTPENSTLPWIDARDTKCSPACKMDTVDKEIQGSEYRYLLDLPGVSGTTWDSLNWKMATGSLVFKVDSVPETINWWHPFLTPGDDFLPVHANLSNLRDQFLWAESNPQHAQRIAERGRKKALYFGREDVQDAYHGQLLSRMDEAAAAVFAEFPRGFPLVTWV